MQWIGHPLLSLSESVVSIAWLQCSTMSAQTPSAIGQFQLQALKNTCNHCNICQCQVHQSWLQQCKEMPTHFATRHMSSSPAPLPTENSVALSVLPESFNWTAATLDRQGQQALYLVYSISESAAKDLVEHLWLGLGCFRFGVTF